MSEDTRQILSDLIEEEVRETTGRFKIQTHDRNPGCAEKFAALEARLDKLEDDPFKRELWQSLIEVKAQLANLNGRLAGYLLAGGVLGAVVSFVAQTVMRAGGLK